MNNIAESRAQILSAASGLHFLLARKIINEATAKAKGAHVKSIKVTIGELSLVTADALQSSFKLVREQTILSDAKLDIRMQAGWGRCRICSKLLMLHHVHASCDCGSTQLEWLSGSEVYVSEVEVR